MWVLRSAAPGASVIRKYMAACSHQGNCRNMPPTAPYTSSRNAIVHGCLRNSITPVYSMAPSEDTMTCTLSGSSDAARADSMRSSSLTLAFMNKLSQSIHSTQSKYGRNFFTAKICRCGGARVDDTKPTTKGSGGGGKIGNQGNNHCWGGKKNFSITA